MPKIKIKKSEAVQDTVAGCVLVPLNKRKDHYPVVASNVIEGTYYRVIEDTGIVRAMLTVMPDGNRVAWDTCAKCHRHVAVCDCKSGVYHPASVAWIRATCDIDYPAERVQDYSHYFDPWGRKTGNPIPRDEPSIGRPPTSPSKTSTTKRVTQTPTVEDGMSVRDIENIDMATLQKEATKQAKRSVRRARSVIRGGKR